MCVYIYIYIHTYVMCMYMPSNNASNSNNKCQGSVGEVEQHALVVAVVKCQHGGRARLDVGEQPCSHRIAEQQGEDEGAKNDEYHGLVGAKAHQLSQSRGVECPSHYQPEGAEHHGAGLRVLVDARESLPAAEHLDNIYIYIYTHAFILLICICRYVLTYI